ncbi:hypothetical protein Ahy_B07g088787 [Arachis hypogaea]|uniref:COPA/B TPR domain-containing protein n=1 Tax=Arachis hypogaea TaxID=3818 RepID=A0A444YFD8_ARAHY|nr:hypothetical protein Ahy_B07g088787 [Arachis hypogaea]
MGLWSRAAAIRLSLPGVDLSALLHSARNPCFLLHVCNHPNLLESAFDGSCKYHAIRGSIGLVLIFSQWTKVLDILDYYFICYLIREIKVSKTSSGRKPLESCRLITKICYTSLAIKASVSVSRALGIDFSINHQARPPFSVFNRPLDDASDPSRPIEFLTDVDYLNKENGHQRDAGSTASTAMVLGDRILVTNVGNSRSIATEMQSESKWKQMGELAMSNGRLDMAEDCLNHVMDLSELLPLYSSLGEAEGISKCVFLASCRKN